MTNAGGTNGPANAANTAAINTAPVSEPKANSDQTETNTNQPAEETPERKQILDALRVPVSKDLK